MNLLHRGKRLAACLCLCLSVGAANAQTGAPTLALPGETAARELPRFRRGFAVGIGAGTQALGFADIAYGFHPHFTARLGYNHLAFDLANRELDASAYGLADNALVYAVDARMSTVQASLDYTPSARLRWLRLSAALHVAVAKSVTGEVQLRDNVRLNDVELTPEELGGMTVVYENTAAVMPYAGIGFGPSLPWKKFAINGDLGAMYRGHPTLTTVGAGLLSDNAALGQDLVRAFGGMMKWHPVAALRLAYRVSQ